MTKNKIFIYLINLVFLFGMQSQAADPTSVAGATAAVKTATANPPKPKSASEIAYTSGTPVENCSKTSDNALRECQTPTGSGFQQAMQLVAVIPSISTVFMQGGDSGQMANMCKLSAAMGLLTGLLNSGQNTTCQNASSACQTVCQGEIQSLTTQYSNAISSNQIAQANSIKQQMDFIKQTQQDCEQKVAQVAQAAQQQQAANQQPMAGMEACQDALAGDDTEEQINCSLAQYQGYSECATVGKTAGSGVTFEPGVGLPTQEDADTDFPLTDQTNSNANQNKTSGSSPNSSGGLSALGSGSSGLNSAAQKTSGGGAKKSPSALMTGNNDSSGGGSGWGAPGSDDEFKSRFAGLNAKKKDLKMLTQKKIAGRNLASDEYGLASDDIWSRIYSRTNTRCTKQLVECAANKSINPYGINKKR